MKVLFVDIQAQLGGAQCAFADLAQAVRAEGVDVVAAVPSGPLLDRLAATGMTVHPIAEVRVNKGFGLFHGFARLFQSSGSLGAVIRREQPDMVHANGLQAFISTYRCGFRLPAVWHVRELRLDPTAIQGAFTRADRTVAAAPTIGRMIRECISSSMEGHLHTIVDGIPLRTFAPDARQTARARLGLPADAPVAAMVADIIPWKRHDLFLQEAAVLLRQKPDMFFVLVGRDLHRDAGRYLGQLKGLAERLGLTERLVWTTDCDDAAELMPAFDVLIHPPSGEPFGRTICEAMSAGVGVCALDSAGPSDIVEDERSGLLINTREEGAFAKAALRLLDDPTLAAKITANARKRIEQHYAIDRTAQEFAKLYERIAADHKSE